jgi:hypothetical protein
VRSSTASMQPPNTSIQVSTAIMMAPR